MSDTPPIAQSTARKSGRKWVLGILAPLLLVAVYLLFWPTPIDPVVWHPPPAPALEGVYAPNTVLSMVEFIGEGVGPKPEDVAIDLEGRIYGGYEDGRIMRFPAGGEGAPEVFADTGGRPLGLHFDHRGDLIVADAIKGLLAITPDGAIHVLSTEARGVPFKFTDDVDVAANGTIYFSDASHKFGPEDYLADLIEHRPNGRLLAYNPFDERTELVMDNLYFANGVAVDPHQEFVLVVETGAYRVMRYWLLGPKAGEAEIFIDNLPGYPDGVSAGSDGIFWVPLAYPRDPQLDALMSRPFLRNVVMRLPAFVQPMPPRYGFVLGLNRDGEVIHNLQDPTGRYAPITSVEEHDGYLYLGSIEMHAIGRIPKPDL